MAPGDKARRALLRQLGDHWRATFYPTGLAHSINMGTASEATPWKAVTKRVVRDPGPPDGGVDPGDVRRHLG